MEFVIGFTKNNLTVHLHFISFTCQNRGIKERSVQLCQSVLYILSAWIVHECDEMQTSHRIIMIIQLFLESSSGMDFQISTRFLYT